MNAAHLHLILNHLPVLAAPASFVLLAAGLWRKDRTLQGVGLAAALVAALAAVPVFLSGEPAEELVEGRPGVSDHLIHPHEEAAEAAFPAVLVFGAAALVGIRLLRRRDDIPRAYAYLLLAFALIASALLARTAFLGGRIHHPEIDSSPPAAAEHS